MSSSQSLGGRDVVALTQFSMEENIISPEELHYTLGKRLGSGTYAKVQAAWSPYERKMVSLLAPPSFSLIRRRPTVMCVGFQP